MSRELNRLGLMILLAFLLMALGSAFWMLIEAEGLRAREDNPRRVLEELNIQRGMIVDRNDRVLAYSAAAENRLGVARVYPHPEAVSAIGHYSYVYGQAGVEEGYNTLLRGDHLADAWGDLWDRTLHHTRQGADLRVTIDLAWQQALAQAMQGHSGAGVVVAVPSGEVLAMVSLPTYDPNTVDAQWESLSANLRHSPLLNRATNGRYQPGGALQTLILSELLARGMPLSTPLSIAPLELAAPDLTLRCTEVVDAVATSLVEAYRHACPRPFALAVEAPEIVSGLENKMQVAGLDRLPELPGFDLMPGPATPSPSTQPTPSPFHLNDSVNLIAAAAGQGSLTVTPLHMVQVIAAVVNQGRGLPLHIADATRDPGDNWLEVPAPVQQRAIMQPGIAAQIRELLENTAWQQNPPLYGHASTAYAGTRQYSWFLGWTTLPTGEQVLMVLVVEAPRDALLGVELAAQTLAHWADFAAAP